MDVTCGIVLFNENDEILVAHPTGAKWDFWSIPKGLYDVSDGKYENCVKRELKEETGIELDDDFTLFEGKMYPYPNRKKILKGFHGFLNIDIHDLKCYSYVTSLNGIAPFPEVDAFTWVKLKDVNKILNKPQRDFIKDIIPKPWWTKYKRI